MPRAYVLIRQHPALRQDAFVAGLRACGYDVSLGGPSPKVARGDIAVLWNGHFGTDEARARAFEAAGGLLLVAENAYLEPPGSKWQHFAIAQHGHNGAGQWATGGPERWDALGVELKPWRSEGSHIVVCCQRGIGSREMASPDNWEQRTVHILRGLTSRPIVVRKHPGKPAAHPAVVAEMREALRGAHACVIWSSANGVRSLVEGVPVIYTAPHWICSGAASNALSAIENPPMPDRLATFRRMAWAQWAASEVEAGAPFRAFANWKAAA